MSHIDLRKIFLRGKTHIKEGRGHFTGKNVRRVLKKTRKTDDNYTADKLKKKKKMTSKFLFKFSKSISFID